MMRRLAPEHWFLSGVGALAVATCFLFRFTHPMDVAVTEAKWSVSRGATDVFGERSRQLEEIARERPSAALDLGWKLARAGKTAASVNLLKRTAEIHPHRIDVAQTLLGVLAEIGRHNEASKLFQTIWKSDATLTDECLAIGAGLMLASGDPAAAIGPVRTLTDRATATAETWTWLGDLLCGIQNFDEAARAYRRADQLRPDDSTTAVKLARALTWAALADAKSRVADGHAEALISP